MYWYDSNFNFIEFTASNPHTAPSNARYARFYTLINDENDLTTNVQIEIGTVATDYIPYQSNELKPEITLRSVPNVEDELNNYDEASQEWLDNWVQVENTARDFNDVVQNKTGWSKAITLTNSSQYTVDIAELGAKLAANFNVLANLIFKVGNDTYTNSTEEEVNTIDARGVAIDNTNPTLRLRILDVDLTTQDDAGVQEYLQANDVDFRYELETPIVTELPELDQVFSFEAGWLEQNGVLNNEITFSVATNFNAKVDAIGKALEEMDDQIADLYEIKLEKDSLNIVDNGGTFIMPTAGYSDVGTGTKPVFESGAITVTGLTILDANKYDVDISDTDSLDSDKIDEILLAGIIKFLRVSDTEIKVRVLSTAITETINMIISQVDNQGGVV
jgi:hypothetical protein